jgi:hypothetical protein
MVAAAPFYAGYVSLLGSHLTTTQNPDGTSTVHVTGSIGLPVALMVVGSLTSLAFFVWNVCLRQGRTGATVGKSILPIRLVNLSEGRPIGRCSRSSVTCATSSTACSAAWATSGRCGTPVARHGATRS